MAVTRAERKKQRKAQQKEVTESGALVSVRPENVRMNHSYWITGYYWCHDMILVEPFCAVRHLNQWKVLNLNTTDLEYHQACQLVNGSGTIFIYEDRVSALDAAEAIENQNILLESFTGYMTENQLVEYMGNMKGAESA